MVNITSSELIYLDGMWLREEQLLQLALRVGNFSLAEHYLCALLAHALMFGNTETVGKLNEVRKHYNLPPMPMPKAYGEDDEATVSIYKQKSYNLDDEARRRFQRMSEQQRQQLLKDCMTLLLTNSDLFTRARHWLAIFLVVRDRLEGERLTQRAFAQYAERITPEGWPEKLKCGEHTAKNFSREVAAEDKGEAYYDMKQNPLRELCERFWNLVKERILIDF